MFSEKTRPRTDSAQRVAWGLNRFFALALAALLLLPLTGCGKKGDPRPPLRFIPLPTKDLKVSQQGRTLLLDMAYPNTTVSGTALGGIDAVELFVLVKPILVVVDSETGEETATLPSAEAREFEAGAEALLTLRGAELGAAVSGDRIQFRLPLAEELPDEPMANIFAVRTIKGPEISELSNLATLAPAEPLPAPRSLRLQARADGVALGWEAGDAEGFDVFRRDASTRGYGDPVGRAKSTDRTFLDTSARYGQRYIYTVRAVGNLDPLVWSDAAGESEIDYEDRFAPPLPTNFVALAERGSVRLRWDPSRAADVAGYVLYRREPGRDFHRITREPVTGVEYLDRNLASGLTYAYRLQVVDLVGNESDLSAPVQTTTR